MTPKEFAEKYIYADRETRAQLISFLFSGITPEWAEEVYRTLLEERESKALSFLVDIPSEVCIKLCDNNPSLKGFLISYLKDYVAYREPILTVAERQLLAKLEK
ncbi:MAG: hypothetical protein ACK4NC_07280 [Candidatus Gracilibacteria bacterium]